MEKDHFLKGSSHSKARAVETQVHRIVAKNRQANFEKGRITSWMLRFTDCSDHTGIARKGNRQQERGTGTGGDGAHSRWQAAPQSQTGGPSVGVREMGKGLAPTHSATWLLGRKWD